MTIYLVAVYSKHNDVRMDFYDGVFTDFESAERYADSLRDRFNIVIKTMKTQ